MWDKLSVDLEDRAGPISRTIWAMDRKRSQLWPFSELGFKPPSRASEREVGGGNLWV